MSGRKKRLVYNTISSFGFQIIAIICGFILPRLILEYYGSETNGLVSSIQQFLQIIAFLELGVGAVVKSSLYKPLADNNDTKISEIYSSANSFFRKIAIILAIYTVGLTFCYPVFINNSFDKLSTAFLIIAMAISYFAQYYFGIVNQLLLSADQKGYIQFNTQSLTLILNIIACAILITNGASIQIVKLTTSLIFLIRPIVYKIYVDRHYSIDKRISYSEEPISQKWNGVAQHVAAIVLDSTNIVILTLFSTLTNVSIYYVYQMVVFGVKQLFISLIGGVQALLGELWAKKEMDNLISFFGWVEWCIHTGAVFLFGCTSILLVPFVKVYTTGINDANYILPVFGLLMVAAQTTECIRLPYNTMILAAGHYKQTQHIFIIAALINVVVSIVTVKQFGLIGVAVGTIVAMVFQTTSMAVYVSKHLIRWPITNFLKQVGIDALTLVLAYVISRLLLLNATTFTEWIVIAFEAVFVVAGCILLVNLVFYRSRILSLKDVIMNKKKW